MVELMATLLIISILVVAGIVSYNRYLNRTRIAEGYVILNAIAKEQAVYYFSNKMFISFKVPFSSSYGFGIIPSGGAKIAIDTSQSSSLTNGSTIPWSSLGNPLSTGTSIPFFLMGMAGKNNSSGTALTGTAPLGLHDPAATTTGLSINVQNPPITGGRCAIDYWKELYNPNAGVADKSWAIMYAMGNFDNSASDLFVPAHVYISAGPSDLQCTQIIKYIETDSSGKVLLGKAFITAGAGH